MTPCRACASASSVTSPSTGSATTIDGVDADREPVMVTREGGEAAAVPMSAGDSASFEETAYLLRNPGDAERLMTSVEAFGLGLERETPQ